MLNEEQTLILSPYFGLYDILVDVNHRLRKINNLIDFSFVYRELKDRYGLTLGRQAEHPIRMFKYLLLKVLYPCSDRGLVACAYTDMSFKYFLGLAPESEVIEASYLSKFRRQRLKDADLLDLLINKTVEIAIEKGIIESKTLIVDATHTCSKYNPIPPIEVLRICSRQLRSAVYKFKEDVEGYKKSLPVKYEGTDLSEEIAYSRALIAFIKQDTVLSEIVTVEEGLNYLEETIDDIKDHFTLSSDSDARTGHKSADTSFFGYKTHIAMTTERIITAATITTGEKNDGPQLETLIEKSRRHLGGEEMVDTVLGDTAYSGAHNLQLANDKEHGFTLVAPLNPMLYKGKDRIDDGFELNKDADLYTCPAGHLAVSKHIIRSPKGKGNNRMRYRFDAKKCACCKRKETCITSKAHSKLYEVSIKTPHQKKQMAFEKTKEFKTLLRDRYMIEAKNAELKNNLAYDTTLSYGINCM